MRYLVLSGLMFALGLLVVSLDARERNYVPVVRLRTSEGFFITAVQARTQDRRQCIEGPERFPRPIRRQWRTRGARSGGCGTALHVPREGPRRC